MKIKNTLIFIFAYITAVLNVQALPDTIISVSSTNDSGWVVIYASQGYRVGWTQADAYGGVSVSAKLAAGGADQTGRAYLTTQIGPGTSVANEIASTNFSFPPQSTNLTLFSGLQLPAGTYYLSIIGDSPTVGSQWEIGYATNADTGTGVTSLGTFGTVGAMVNSYFPASPPYSDGFVAVEFTVQGTDLTHPALQIAQSGNSVLVSWTTNSPGFGLESANSLTATNWQSITQPIIKNSDSYLFVTNATGAQFYRLRK
jgi:hypothetical protein